MLLGVLAVSSNAHEVRPAVLKFVELDGSRWQVKFRQPQVQGRFLNLQVETNCIAGKATQTVGISSVESEFALDCSGSSLKEIAIPGLKESLLDTVVTVDRAGSTSEFLLNGNNPAIVMDDPPGVPAYLLLGFEHLVFGIDHVLFVLLLLYLVRGWRKLLLIITSFTLAHSITLGLAAYDVVTVPQAPIESLIALSIVLLGAEVLKPASESRLRQYPWLVTFAFGLLHGLGFAGALAEIGLPRNEEVMALFLFNVGLELGQIAVVIVALMIAAAIQRGALTFVNLVKYVPVYASASVAAFWFIERSMGILLST